MIILTKLALGILWIIAFLATCMIMGIAFPVIFVLERAYTLTERSA